MIRRKGEDISIPFEKYVLKNGLTLLVHEDHSNPIVRIDVTYHVGSAREEMGRSGLAHFFEHMMFEGSKHVRSGDHFRIITESGGTLNGTTNRDRTNYFETLPANQLETGLWLEADRMGFLLEALTEEKFEIQRSTVKNERRQNYDNRPYGLLGEKTASSLYPFGHPYSWLTIGHMRDIDATTLQDLKDFFLRWYGPNNAVLTVGGDVKPEDVLEKAKKYFESIPSGPGVEKAASNSPVLEKDIYVTEEDKIDLPLFQMVFPSMPRHHEEEYALDCFAEIFGSGPTSILYKNLIKNQKAINAFAYNNTSELAGEFTLGALARPGTKLSEIESIIRDSFSEFESTGVSEEDVKKFIAVRKSTLLFSLSTVSGRVSQLAAFHTFTGDPGFLSRDIEFYESLSPEKVMDAFRKYVQERSSLNISWLPEGQTNLMSKEANLKIQENSIPSSTLEIQAERRVVEELDRSIKPAHGPAPIVPVPDFWTSHFQNGARSIGAFDNSIPISNISLVIDGGARSVSNPNEQAGLSNLMAMMLNESTLKRSSEEIARELDLLGSSISASSGQNFVSFNVQAMSQNIHRTMEFLEEILLSPAFDPEDFDRLKNQQIEGLKNRENQPSAIANLAFSKLIFGKNNSQGNPLSGRIRSLESIALEQVRGHYLTCQNPGGMNTIVVGDLDQEEAIERLGFLEKLKPGNSILPPNGPTPLENAGKIFLIDIPGAAQSEIRIGYYTGLKFDALGEFQKCTLMNFPLGGDFNSRINQNLREKRGITYGARTFFSGDQYGGYFQASASIEQDSAGLAISEFLRELSEFGQHGMTDEEFRFMKTSIGQREALKYEGLAQKGRFLGKMLRYNLPSDYPKRQKELLESLDQSDLSKVAAKWIDIDKMSILAVGDGKSIRPQLEPLGYPIIELDSDGEPL